MRLVGHTTMFNTRGHSVKGIPYPVYWKNKGENEQSVDKY